MCKRWCWLCDEEPHFSPVAQQAVRERRPWGRPRRSPGRGRDEPAPLNLNPALPPQNRGAFVPPSPLAWRYPPQWGWAPLHPPAPGERGCRALIHLYAFFLPSWKMQSSRNFQPFPALVQLLQGFRQLAQGKTVALYTSLCINRNYFSFGLQ